MSQREPSTLRPAPRRRAPRRRASFRFGGCCRRSLSRLRFHAAIVTLEAAKLFTLSAWRHPAPGAWMQQLNGLVEVNVSVKAELLGWGQEQTPISGDLGHPLQAERSHSGTTVMNDCEGHQRSFSVRPSERPLHLQDRALASGWHQAIGEGPVSHRAKWHSRPEDDIGCYEPNRSFALFVGHKSSLQPFFKRKQRPEHVSPIVVSG